MAVLKLTVLTLAGPPPDAERGIAMSDDAIKADGLRKAFGAVTALDGLSLRAPAGSVLGLLGPNGSGKTTTVSILAA